MKVLTIIPARAGSKGIPKKNIIDLLGKPLIAWTIEAALSAKSLSIANRVIVSTDSHEIADIAISYGAEVPFIRPKQYATDTAGAYETIKHAYDEIHKGQRIDSIMYLQPTSPLRTSDDISAALALFKKNKIADTLVSVCEVPHQYHPSKLMQEFPGTNFLRFSKDIEHQRFNRHDIKSHYVARNGPAILMIRENIIKQNKLYGNNIISYLMPKERSFDIDDIDDLKLIRKLLSYQGG